MLALPAVQLAALLARAGFTAARFCRSAAPSVYCTTADQLADLLLAGSRTTPPAATATPVPAAAHAGWALPPLAPQQQAFYTLPATAALQLHAPHLAGMPAAAAPAAAHFTPLHAQPHPGLLFPPAQAMPLAQPAAGQPRAAPIATGGPAANDVTAFAASFFGDWPASLPEDAELDALLDCFEPLHDEVRLSLKVGCLLACLGHRVASATDGLRLGPMGCFQWRLHCFKPLCEGGVSAWADRLPSRLVAMPRHSMLCTCHLVPTSTPPNPVQLYGVHPDQLPPVLRAELLSALGMPPTPAQVRSVCCDAECYPRATAAPASAACVLWAAVHTAGT